MLGALSIDQWEAKNLAALVFELQNLDGPLRPEALGTLIGKHQISIEDLSGLRAHSKAGCSRVRKR